MEQDENLSDKISEAKLLYSRHNYDECSSLIQVRLIESSYSFLSEISKLSINVFIGMSK